MSRLEKIRKERLEKLEQLRKAGIEPYPLKVARTYFLSQAKQEFDKLQKTGKIVKVTGRVMALREHGGATFADLKDFTGKLQIFFSQKTLGPKKYQLLEQVDIGDFLGVSGKVFVTKAGEQSLEASSFTFLAKTLRPLPSQWYGLEDKEIRFRKRYLDLLLNQAVKERFLIRFDIIRHIREFLIKKGFLEVETPILQTLAGGALAEPFKTVSKSLDLELYLRIAPELYLKRLLLGGFEKIFELGRVFRNEGVDREHNPEFTMLELYWAYQDHESLMDFIKSWLQAVVEQINKGNLKIVFGGKTINWSKFDKVDFSYLLQKTAKIDWEQATHQELVRFVKKFDTVKPERLSKGKLADEIFKKAARTKIIQPTFVVNLPAEISPFAKKLPGSQDKTARFLLVAGGLELINGFAEINDPLDQAERFKQQLALRARGDQEVQPNDKAFVEALEYGMPPTAGLGLGVDRLVMILTDAPSLREVILFPTLKPLRSSGNPKS